jgi:CheY-like chemotaxis protein/tetratricopeptide (TPR) repeat protein
VARLILHVDDEDDLPAGFTRELASLGYRRLHTDDPDRALDAVRDRAVDLVLLEVLLSRFDGFDLLEEMRACDPHVPVVILTRAERSPELYARSLELGACDFFSQPVLASELLEAVKSFAGRKERDADEQVDTGDSSALHARLDECPLAEFLHRLRSQGANGACVVVNAGEQRGIQLRNGSPVAVSSNRRSESFEEYLFRTGRITREQREEVVAQLGFGMGSPEEILVGMGAFSEQQVRDAENARVEQQLFDAFGWESGSLRFHPGKRLKSGTEHELDAEPAALLMRAALSASTPRQVRQALERRGALYASSVESHEESLRFLDREAQALLRRLDGECTVSQLRDEPGCDERLLHALWIAGLVELTAEPVLLLEEISGGAELDPADDRFAAGESPARPLDTEGAESGPAPEAEPNPEATERAREAETWFGRGRAFMHDKLYEKAVEAFGMAAHLDPSQGEYVAHLGYTLYLSRPHEPLVRREAMEHIAKGIKLSPERENPYLFLGRIFHAIDDLDSARKVFRRAAKVHPDSFEVKRALRMLEVRSSKPKGLLARLLKR